MSLQFIVGPSGSGKSHYLYQYIIQKSQERPEKQYLFLVPDQYTMQAKRDYVQQSERGGMLNVDVLSFGRLAHRIFYETGHDDKMILDDAGKNFILKKVAGKNAGRFKVLGSNLNKIGYIEEVKSVLSEFTQYGLTNENLEELMDKLDGKSTLSYKLQDIAMIYREFHEFMEERYITGEELLTRLATLIPESDYLKDCVVVLDGFTGFTPVQNQVIERLLVHCEEVLVSVIADQKTKLSVYEHPYQLYALSKKTVTTLSAYAHKNNVPIKEQVQMYEPTYRLQNSPALAFLQKNLFTYQRNTFIAEQEQIQIYAADNNREEIEFVAQKIRNLVRTKGYRYRDIGIVMADVTAYSKIAEHTFERYRIPVFMDDKESVLQNVLVEYIRSLLEITEQNFSYESILRHLRTGLTEFTVDEIDRLENYVLASGIKGYKKWSEPWTRTTRTIREDEVGRLEELRKSFMDARCELFAAMKKRYKTVYEVTEALHAFLLKEEVQQKVKEYELRFEREGELVRAREYAQIYPIVIGLFDKFVEILGTERISMKEYCELFDAGLVQAKVGTTPPGIDQVVVGDMERTRLPEIRVLFFVGMSDAYIPGNMNRQALISDSDKEKMAAYGISLAPGAKENLYVQRFYMHMYMSKPSELLYLTYSKMKSDKAAARPAYVVENIKQLFPNLVCREVPKNAADMEFTKKSAMHYLIEGLLDATHRQSGMWQEVYSWYKREPKWQKKLAQLLDAAYCHRPEEKLQGKLATQLYGSLLKNSVTRLEQFNACAYAHFLNYGLGLQERETFAFRMLDFGTLFHRALELYARKVEHEGWTLVSSTRQEELVSECVDETITGMYSTLLADTARDEYVINRLQRMMKRTVWAMTQQLCCGDFIPQGYEVEFGRESELSVAELPLQDGNKMLLRGKIDRIDICEDGDKVYVKVIDYKTGKKAFDISDLYQGIQMQLVTYMLVAMDMEQKKYPDKEIVPAGILYYRIDDPMVSDGPDAEVEAEILSKLRPDGMVNSDEQILHRLDRELGSSSIAIPVKRKKDNTLSATSDVLSTDDFINTAQYAKRKMQQMGEQIMDGEVSINPYKKDGQCSCTYCPYAGVCKFDEKIPGYEYRNLEKEKREAILEKIRQEANAWE